MLQKYESLLRISPIYIVYYSYMGGGVGGLYREAEGVLLQDLNLKGGGGELNVVFIP